MYFHLHYTVRSLQQPTRNIDTIKSRTSKIYKRAISTK